MTAVNLQDYENTAILLKEAETELLRQKAELAFVFYEHDAGRHLAGLWGVSTATINTLARIYYEIGVDFLYPDAPLSLYRAALDTDEPREWLLRALDEGWSARQLRDAADVSKGKRVSSVPWLPNVEASIEGPFYTERNERAVTLIFDDYEPSGEPPLRVRVRAVEVLKGK